MSIPSSQNTPQTSPLERSELEAVLETRRELGADLEPALVDSFADRIDQIVEARVRAQYEVEIKKAEHAAHGQGKQLALAIVSAGVAIPLTAIAASLAGLPAILVVWVGIVAINFAMAWQRGQGGNRS